MAKATRCDRCGKLYPNTENNLTPIFVGGAYFKASIGRCTESFDLCTDCTADLIAWFIGRNHGRVKLQEYGIVDKF